MFKSVYSLVDFLSMVTHRAGSYLFLPALTILITVDVILRYFFSAPLEWSHEVNGFFLLFLFFGSITHCWNVGRHIRMLMIFERLNGPARAAAEIAAALTGIILFGALGVQSFLEIPLMIETNETGELFEVPHWPFKVYVGLCSLVFVLRLFVYLLDLIIKSNEDGRQP